MRKYLTIFYTMVLTIVFPQLMKAQIVFFQEDFDNVGGPVSGGAGTYNFPAGWLLMNVNNAVPSSSVSYVNDAWERREDFNFDVADSAAFSTSWKSPAGAADDWMWTPSIAIPATGVSSLSWNAVTYDAAYPDGYEVRVMVAPDEPSGTNGSIGNMITNSTVLFSVAAENSSWTARSVSLAAYAGQNIRIAFRNNSNDKFLLLIDDITFSYPNNNDISLISTNLPSEYTLMPESEITPIVLSGKVQNVGVSNAINAHIRATITRNGIQVYSGISNFSAILLQSEISEDLVVPSYTPTQPGVYEIAYEAIMDDVDLVPENNTDTSYISVDRYIYARDKGIVTGGLGIGAGNGGYLGNSFTLPNNGKVGSVGIQYTRGYTGKNYGVAVFATTAGIPTGTPLYTTVPATYPDNAGGFFTIPFPSNLNLNAGDYVFAAIEFDSTVQVANTNEIFTNGKTWVQWPTSPSQPTAGAWMNVEQFGASFSKPFVIRPNFCPQRNIDFTVSNPTCNQNNGSVFAQIGDTESPYTYLWNDGATTSTRSFIGAGTYNVTITDALFCQYTGSVDLTSTPVPTASITGNTSICAGRSTILTASGGNTYLWSNGATTAGISVSPTSLSTYTVTVTNASGCTDDANVSVNVNTSPTASITGNTSICAGSTATLTASGGNTYSWNNGVTTAGLSVILNSSTTYIVTVTGSNGCTDTESFLVNVNQLPDNTVTQNGNVLTANQAGASYQWINCTTGLSIINANSVSYTVPVTGSYSVYVNLNGCPNTSSCINVTVTGINSLGKDNKFNIYPNPANNEIFIEFEKINKNTFARIISIEGKTIVTTPIIEDKTKINVETLSKGVYILELNNETDKNFVKIIKE
jgi:hypothetical protein